VAITKKPAKNPSNSMRYSDRNFRGINSLQRVIFFPEYIPTFLLSASVVSISIVMYVYTLKNVLYQKRPSNLKRRPPYWISLMRVRWTKCLMPSYKTRKNRSRWIFSNFSVEYLHVKKSELPSRPTYVSRSLACRFWQRHNCAKKMVPLDRT
jgi:hypothetical protein